MDQDIVAQLTQSNHTLTATNKLLEEQLKVVLDANSILIKKMGNPNSMIPKKAFIPEAQLFIVGTQQPLDQQA
jgi:hypothetical protein